MGVTIVTSVFSTSSIIIPDPRQDERCVANDLPGQLQPQGRQEAKYPGVELIRAPEEVEDQTSHHQAQTVRVKHVAGRLGGVPFSGGTGSSYTVIATSATLFLVIIKESQIVLLGGKIILPDKKWPPVSFVPGHFYTRHS